MFSLAAAYAREHRLPHNTQKGAAMYEREYRTLFALIAPLVGGKVAPCVLNGTVFDIENAKLLAALAKKHSIANLLYFAVREREDFPREISSALEKELFSSAHRALLQEHESTRVFAELHRRGVPYLVMKGAVIRPLYPMPEMRVSCDVDVFYDKKHRRAVDRMMEELGYTLRESDPNHDEYVHKSGVLIEMHRNLVTEYPTVDRYYEDIWERLVPVDGCEYRMSDEDFYIYATVHTMKHFVTAGTGIRSVMDAFVYLAAKPDLDRNYLMRELDKLRLTDFHLMIEKLAAVWFGGEAMPDALAPISDYILGSGTYGIAVQRAVNDSASVRGGKLGYLFFRAFPPYHWMAEKYPSLRRLPFLLPVFWLWRLLTVPFKNKEVVGKTVRAVRAADAADAMRLEHVMKTAGLYRYR